MILSANIINHDALLNNFSIQGPSISFFPASTVNFSLQLMDPIKNIRYVPPSTAAITFTFNNSDFTTFTQTSTFIDIGDRSLININLTPTQTALMVGGNLLFTVDVLGDGTQIINGLIYNGLSYVDTSI